MLCVSQQFLADECRGFMCQPPGQTANNEGLTDSLYPAVTEMIPRTLELLWALFKKCSCTIMLSTAECRGNVSMLYIQYVVEALQAIHC